MFTILVFIIILSILVLVHEFGHFLAARKSGMRVYEFGLGFPPRAFGVYRDPVTKKFVWVGRGKSGLRETVGGEPRIEEYPATVYSVNWLPLGGFCKIKGESGEAAGETDSFGHHTAWRRIAVLVAGVVMNILFAAVLLGIGFGIGIPADVSDGVPPGATIVEEPGIVVQEVVKGSPADEAGFHFGDRIVSVDDRPVTSTAEFVEYVSRHGEQEIDIGVKKQDDRIVAAIVRPRPLEDGGAPKVGLHLGDVAVIRYPWYEALPKGFVAAFVGLINVFVAFFILIKELIMGRGLAFDVAGPVGIASVVGASARLGIQYLIHVTATISLSLAAINILPIPALDGGRVLFVLIEKITRKKVPMEYEQLAHTIGFVLLMILIVVVTWRDVVGLVR